MTVVALFQGVFLLVFGVIAALYPYKVAKHSEKWDAFGSKTARWAVEPAEWKVKVTRIGGVVMIVLGTYFVLV